MENPICIFLSVAEVLNKNHDIIPILYGSLGLNLRLNDSCAISDVDILVPLAFLEKKWDALLNSMDDLDFVLSDIKEREFRRGADIIAFADEEDLASFAGVDPTSFELRRNKQIEYRLPGINDFLKIYKSSSLDGYRKKNRGKIDQEKIDRIMEYMSNHKR